MVDGHIQLRNVCKHYRADRSDGVEVLRDFSLTVRRGEVLGIFGPTGCGKSTILGIIAQTEPADAGTVLVGGVPPTTGDVACLFQDYSASLFPWFSCAENIAFSLRLQGVRRRRRIERTRALARELKITVDLQKYPYQLSGGQQQLVALARALCNSPSAIVMDEPFNSLDATMRERVRTEAIRIVTDLGLTALLVSHNLEDCILCSDRVVFLTPLPARIHRIETVKLRPEKHRRKIHSDQFSEVLEEFRTFAAEARNR